MRRRVNVVTGGAGFVGSHLVNSLIDDNEEVVVVDDLSTGNVQNLQHAIASGRGTFVYLDIAQNSDLLLDAVAQATAGRVDRVFHLASPASPEAFFERPWDVVTANSLGTIATIELAIRHGARLLLTSTSEVYGDPLRHPQSEDYWGNVDPIGRRSCYDEGKRFSEAAVAAAVRSRRLDARIVRLFNCYGPNMESSDGRLIPALFSAVLAGRPMPIHGTGQQTRSMTYVGDAVRLIRMVMERDQFALQPVNVGSDDEHSVLVIAQAVAAAAGVPFSAEYLPAREGDPQRRRPDLTLARTYGWLPQVRLTEGLAFTLQALLESRVSFV